MLRPIKIPFTHWCITTKGGITSIIGWFWSDEKKDIFVIALGLGAICFVKVDDFKTFLKEWKKDNGKL